MKITFFKTKRKQCSVWNRTMKIDCNPLTTENSDEGYPHQRNHCSDGTQTEVILQLSLIFSLLRHDE